MWWWAAGEWEWAIHTLSQEPFHVMGLTKTFSMTRIAEFDAHVRCMVRPLTCAIAVRLRVVVRGAVAAPPCNVHGWC